MKNYQAEIQILGGADVDMWNIRLELLEQIQNLVILVVENKVAYANSAGLRWLGYQSPEEILGIVIQEIFHPDYHELMHIDTEALEEEGMIPLKMIRNDFSHVDVEMWVKHLHTAQKSVVMFVANDITDHLSMARALRSREQKLEGIINTVADGVITISAKGNLETFNPAAQRLFGYSESEIVGQNIQKLLPKRLGGIDTAGEVADETGMEWQRILKVEPELQGIKKNGEKFPLVISIRELMQGDTLSYTGIVRDITARKRAESRIRKLAHHDHLTGLPNRFLFADRIIEAINRARRNKNYLAVMYMDLDKFKPVNDKYGHDTGDQVLIELSKRFVNSIRATDTVARVGGDEFIVLLEGITHIGELPPLIEKILDAAQQPIDIDTGSCVLGASAGISLFPDDSEESSELIKFADQAMFKAKKTPDTNYLFYESTSD